MINPKIFCKSGPCILRTTPELQLRQHTADFWYKNHRGEIHRVNMACWWFCVGGALAMQFCFALLPPEFTGLPLGRNFYLHTHPIPTENPMGIPTGSPYPQNPKILHIHARTLSFHYKRPILICCLSPWQLATTLCMFYAKVSVTDQRSD